MKFSKRLAAMVGTATLAVGSTGAAGYAYAASHSGTSGHTAGGRTYGPAPQPGGQLPDLVKVLGNHGVVGYVDSSVLCTPNGKQPTNPQQALEYMRTAPARWTIPVYNKDGKAQVDTFTVMGPSSGGVSTETGN